MKKILVAITILASAVLGTRAGILSDNFVYPDGEITIAPGTTWISNTGTGAGKEMDVTNDTLIVTGSRSEDIAHWLTGAPYITNGTPTTLYAKYTLKCTGLPSLSGTYFSHFTGTNGYQNGPPNLSGFRARVWASYTNYVTQTGVNPANGEFLLGISSSGYYTNAATGTLGASCGNSNWVWGATLHTNTSYLIVTKYVMASGSSTLWVMDPNATPPDTEPVGVTDPSVLPVEPVTGYPTNGVINIQWFSFRQNSGGGAMLINGLKVGTSWADLFKAPTIGPAPADQNVAMNHSTAALAFTVASPVNPVSAISLSYASANTALVPNDDTHIALTKDASGNCTVTVTPATGQQGVATIVITATDTSGGWSSDMSFRVFVGAPTISPIPNQITSIGGATAAIPFTTNDTEGDTLTLYKASSNPTLVPTTGIVIGGSSGSPTVTVTPAASQTGASWITLSVGDGHNTNSTTFAVTVTPAALGLVYIEDFAYNTFDVPNALYDAGGGSGGGWGHISGLNEYQMTVSNNMAFLYGTNTECLGSGFIGSAQYDGSKGYVFYSSFTACFTYKPSPIGDYFWHLSTNKTDTAGFRDKLFAQSSGAPAGKFRLGVANYAGGVSAQNPRNLSTNVTYEVVTRYNAATGDSTLWVNPANEQSAGVTANDNPGSAFVGGVGLREPGSGIGDIYIGPMKVGTSFANVFTAPTASFSLTYAVVDGGANLQLTWGNPLYALQSTSDLTVPFDDVSTVWGGVTSGYKVPLSGAPQFFRLKY